MRTIKHFLKNELVDEVPFTAQDYLILLDDIDSTIGDSVKIRALSGDTFALQTILDKEAEKQVIREEAKAHLGNNWWEQQ